MSVLIANSTRQVVDTLCASGYLAVAILAALGYPHPVVSTHLVLPLAGFLVGWSAGPFGSRP